MSMLQSRLSARQNRNVERRQLLPVKNTIPAKRFQFSKLSLDILLRIQLHLSPQEILSFRKCCKAIWISTQARIVWLEALRSACVESQVSCSTFSNMKDMSRLSLEFSAMSPHLFLNKLRAHAKDTVRSRYPLSPSGIRILPSPPEKPAFSQIVVVPGGRYLLSTSLPSLIELWDLGDGSHMMLTSPIASCFVQDLPDNHPVSFDFTTIPTPDGTGFRILYLLSTGTGTGNVYFYEIFPLDPNPAFILRRSLCLSAVELEAMNCLQACGDHLAFATSERIVVWDFAKHTASSFTTDFLTAGPIFLIQNDLSMIVVTREDHFAIFRVPPHQQLSSSGALPELFDDRVRRPVLQILYPLHSAKFSWPLDWYGNVPFQITGMEEFTNNVVTLTYAIETVTHQTGAVFCPIPMLQDSIQIPEAESTLPSQEQFYTFSIGLAGGVSAMVSRSHQNLTLGILGENKKEEVNLWTWREEDTGDDDQVWTLCPFSGRLCVLTAKRREIRILDFLRPPA